MIKRWLIILTFVFPPAARAGDPAREASRLFDDMKFGQALKRVNQVLRSPKAQPGQIKTAYRVQGLCFAARGKNQRAVAAFRRLLALDPAYRLPSSVSPKLRPPFEKAQALSRGKPGLALSHQPPEKPGTLAGLALQVELAGNPFKLAAAVRLLYWTGDGKRQWSGARIRRPGRQTVKLPKTLEADTIEYYFEATNQFGGVLARAGSREEPFRLDTASAAVAVAPLIPEKTSGRASPGEQEDPETGPEEKLAAGPKKIETGAGVPDVGVAAALPPAEESRPDRPEENGSAAWYQSWWFWTGVGVVVAGVATGVALGVSADQSSGDIQYRITLR